MNGLPLQFDHERYEELCALATAGALTTEESEALFAHLDQCAECSKVFAQYQSLASEGMPLLADLHRPIPETAGFNETQALARLLESAKHVEPDKAPKRFSLSQWMPAPVWRGLAAAALMVGVAFASYRVGEHRHQISVEQPRIDISHAANTSRNRERQSLQAALQEAQQREADLQALASTRNGDIDKLRADAQKAQKHLDDVTASLSASKSDMAAQVTVLTEQRNATTARLQDAERIYQGTQDELNLLHSQRKQDLAHIASLESQVGSLTVALNDQSSHTKDDEQYLASDRDIRDLIGARNLYIADIMDVREDGSSRKPFGRVFYTKTKSLIFYAYDLDHQPGVKKASTFRVWGRTGPDDRKPLNLGVLYMDSETNRRWTLRVDNPEQLARLDAVFVTIEPREQTDTPTGKPFLYASLRREPNHP
jgi:hypothetical protein